MARVHRPYLLIMFDTLAWFLAYAVFTLLRYAGTDMPVVWAPAMALATGTATLQVLVGVLLRLYQGRAKLATLEDMVLLGFLTVGCGAIASLVNAVSDPLLMARSVPIAATFMALFLMGVGRAI